MQRTCQITGQKFEISEKEQQFCRKMGLPLPEICPEERLRQLMATRNEWKLYRRKCDFSGEMILSAYDVAATFPIYKNEIWWSDKWNALDFGRDFDFSRGFFEQFAVRNVIWVI